jgi:hypothetical protein
MRPNAATVTLGSPGHGVASIAADAEHVGNDQRHVRMSAALSAGRSALISHHMVGRR